MSFQDLQDTITELGSFTEKIQGDLIKHEEWNALVSSVKSIADELSSVYTRVDGLESFVGFESGADYTLRGRIESLEGFVGEAGDTSDMDTLSGRVIKLEETDVVEQAEFETFMTDDYNDFKDSIEPLRDQYVVTLETTKANYNLGERAVLTATVKTLDGDIPPNRPWVDFITSWGRLKPFDGFTTRSGIDGHSISVRTDSSGIAKVRVSSEHQQEMSEEDEIQVEGFFDTVVQAGGKTVMETLNDAPNASGETAAGAYTEMKNVYQRSSMQFMHRFADTYYVGMQAGHWQGGVGFGGNWKYYRSTVMAIAKEDGDPTTPDTKSAASAIQIAFKDWVGPWIDWYFEYDEPEVNGIIDVLEPRVGPDIYVTLQGFKITLEDEVQSTAGVIHQNKILNAFGKAVDQIDIPVDPEVSSRVKETVQYGVGSQQSWNIMKYSEAAGGAGTQQPGFGTVMNQAIQLSAVDNIDSDVSELKGSMSTLQESAAKIGTDVLGTMSLMESNIVKFNVPDQETLMGNISNIQTHVNEILGKINQP